MASSDKDRRIVLVGKTGAGKSSTGNTILGEAYFQTGYGLRSVTNTCEGGEVMGGRNISVIDTPGLFDTEMSEEQLGAEIEKCIYMSVPGPHAFLLVIRLDVRFTDEERNAVRWIQKNFGEEAAHYTIVLFTHGDHLKGESLDEYISESNDLMALVHSCGGRFHSFNNGDMGNRSQVTKLLEKIERMVEENKGQHYTNEKYKDAQKKINQEAFRQRMIDGGKKVLTAIGAAVTVGAVAAAGVGAAVTVGATEAEAGTALTIATAVLAALKGKLGL